MKNMNQLTTLDRIAGRNITPAVILVCAEPVCTRMITLFEDGSNLRSNLPMPGFDVLEQAGVQIEQVLCNKHGGSEFIPTQQLDQQGIIPNGNVPNANSGRT